MIQKKYCKMCGKEIRNPRSDQVTCSRECSRENQRMLSKISWRRKHNQSLLKPVMILLLGIFFISLVSAVNVCGNDNDYLGEFAMGDSINLTQSCPSCTFVNLSEIIFPDSSFSVLNVAMTKNGVEYNYSGFSNTSQLGCYTYIVLGDKDGVNEVESFDFMVTPSGITQSSIFNNSTLIISLMLSFLLLGLGIYFKISVLGFIGSLLIIITGVYTMIYGFNNYTDMYTRAVAMVVIGVGIIFMFVSAYEWIPWGGGSEE